MVWPSAAEDLRLREPSWSCGELQAEDLLDGGRGPGRIIEHRTPLVRVAVEEHEGVRHQLRDRLRTGATEKSREAGDLRVVEASRLAITSVDGHLGEAAGQVIAGVPRFAAVSPKK